MFPPYNNLKKLLKGSNKNIINVILDTSGSRLNEKNTNKDLNVLAYILNKKYSVNLIQVDSQIEEVITLKNSNELNNIKFKGGGGTILQEAIDFISDSRNRLNTNSTLLLTDMLFESLNFKNYHNNVLVVVDEIIENRIVGNPKLVKQVLSK
jgi:predicted metal-dependent peptidase